MTKKAAKRPPKTSKQAPRKAASKASVVVKGSIADPPQPAREGPDNLRRRAQWFQRRRSGGERDC